MKRVLPILLIVCLLLGTSPLAFTVRAQDAPVIALPDPSIIPDLLARVNRVRARRGLAPYELNEQLSAAAQDQANWLVQTGLRRHFRPGGIGPSARVAAAGFAYQGWCCGENYYMSIDATPDMVWTFWINSPSHLVNIIHWEFTHVGIGMATNGTRHAYVMVFAEALGTPVDVP
jgi:uncharacterized protein YkwD